MKNIILFIMPALLLFASCEVRDTPDECDPIAPVTRNGAVAVNVFVERFGGPLTRTSGSGTDLYEGRFNDRIENLTYYLYRDDRLVEYGPVDNCKSIESPNYTFSRSNLAPGEYKLALMANCSEDVVAGDMQNLSSLTILYPGYDKTADYFVDMVAFEVSENETTEVDTWIKRVHGVARYTFEDMPADVRYVEVSMDGLTSNGFILGTYSGNYNYTTRIPVNTTTRAGDESVLVGTFPTATGLFSTFNIALYDKDEQLLMEKTVVGNEYTVVRNRLLDLTATVNNNEIDISVTIDPEWDDPNDGSGTGIE